ncbi:unnamed protein product [Ascophyllum nodosum]
MRAKVSTRKADFFPLGTSRVTPRARTPASSRREPEGILLKAAVDSSPPTPLMSGGHSWKASVPDGAYAAVFFGDAPVSKAVLVTDTKDDAPPGMKALYVGLSAAGAGASGVEAVVRGEGGTPVRLTSWAKSSNVPRPQTHKKPSCFLIGRRTTTGPRVAAFKHLCSVDDVRGHGIYMGRGHRVFPCFSGHFFSRAEQVSGGRFGVGGPASYRQRR